MNSLEFINQEIEDLNNKIKYLKEKHYTSFVRNYINYCEEKLEMFQQIKTELEAWESVKDKINITEYYDNEQDYEEDINSHNALCLNSNLKIQNSNNEEDWFIPLDNEDCKKLKKALEVKE